METEAEAEAPICSSCPALLGVVPMAVHCSLLSASDVRIGDPLGILKARLFREDTEPVSQE